MPKVEPPQSVQWSTVAAANGGDELTRFQKRGSWRQRNLSEERGGRGEIGGNHNGKPAAELGELDRVGGE